MNVLNAVVLSLMKYIFTKVIFVYVVEKIIINDYLTIHEYHV